MRLFPATASFLTLLGDGKHSEGVLSLLGINDSFVCPPPNLTTV